MAGLAFAYPTSDTCCNRLRLITFDARSPLPCLTRRKFGLVSSSSVQDLNDRGPDSSIQSTFKSVDLSSSPSRVAEEGDWSISDSSSLYRVPAWGSPFFHINAKGNVVVRPEGSFDGEISLHLFNIFFRSDMCHGEAQAIS